jgi:hypothetical protein
VRVLRAVFRCEGLSGRRVAAHAGISPSASKAALDDLVATGIVQRTASNGRFSYTVESSHCLAPSLEQLFSHEQRVWDQLAQRVKNGVRAMAPATILVGLGISSAGEITLALAPIPTAGPFIDPTTEEEIRSHFGVRIKTCVEGLHKISPAERVWPLETGPRRSDDQRRQEQTLRFFGITPATSARRKPGAAVLQGSGPGLLVRPPT